MRQRFAKLFNRLKKDESGTASVEFILVFPAFLSLMLMSIELGYVTMRHTLLERGLDIAVRQIRLGTGNPGTHDQVKTVICDNAGFLFDCEDSLRLEMRPVDLRAYSTLGAEPLCVDRAEPVDPAEVGDNFQNNGQPNQLMVMRACYIYDPFFPDAFLGEALNETFDGQPAIISTAAFVQEPL